MNPDDLSDLRAEFDTFVREKCVGNEEESHEHRANPDMGDAVDNEPVPAFVDAIAQILLAPSQCGVYISRFDIKRVAEAIDESLPIKERAKMLKALFRHTTKRSFLEAAFSEFNRHINGRILIYQELSEAFVSSQHIFEGHIDKAVKTQKIFKQIIDDFDEIEPTFDPMLV